MIGFIEPINVFSNQDEENEKDRERAEERFINLCFSLLYAFPDNAQEYTIFEGEDIVTIHEIPLCIIARDGSSLHILPYGHHNDEQDYHDVGIAVVEHAPSGKVIDGYVYSFDPDQNPRKLSRVPIKFDDENSPQRSTVTRFSVIDMYQKRDELVLLEANDRYVNNSDRSTELWELTLGCTPSEEEIRALEGILVCAKPYPQAA